MTSYRLTLLPEKEEKRNPLNGKGGGQGPYPLTQGQGKTKLNNYPRKRTITRLPYYQDPITPLTRGKGTLLPAERRETLTRLPMTQN